MSRKPKWTPEQKAIMKVLDNASRSLRISVKAISFSQLNDKDFEGDARTSVRYWNGVELREGTDGKYY